MVVRERLSMDKDWSFHLGEVPYQLGKSHHEVYTFAKAGGIQGPAGMEWNDNEWETVQLPHDWSYKQDFDRVNGVPSSGYKPRGIGWYRKKFKLDEADNGKQLLLEFDGIASKSTIYFNGSVLKRHVTGYTSFAVDISDYAHYGDRPNLLAVKVDAAEPEGWWYEGAGIYRHVWLTKKSAVHIDYRGVWVRPEKVRETEWMTHVETTLENEAEQTTAFTLHTTIKDAHDQIVTEVYSSGTIDAYSKAVMVQGLPIRDPQLWDVDAPHLYSLHSELMINETLVDCTTTAYGYRTIRICPDQGFFLNERPLKLKGTCNHQDHAGVGVAVPDGLQEYRIRRLKDMGSNAYRSAHHNPTPELLDVCDRLGMLVMDENRNFDSSTEGLSQLEDMVTRDRNHPCVIMYSLFNEEPLQSTPNGRKMFKRMYRTVKRLDPDRPVIGAMNGGVMEDEGAADVMDITGINYMEWSYDKFKQKHPNQPMIGSETISAFSTRGEYKNDTVRQIFDSYDQEKAPWGATARDGWKAIATRDYMMGTFVWTGFDYRGEPTPYEWPSISTHFGIMDTCGFPKDAYYLYQAFWLDEPVLHMVPHWNWQGQEGKPIRIMTHTNCDEVVLYVNGRQIGKKSIDIYEQAEWEVPYEQGTVRMEGYRDGELVKVTEVETTEEAATLQLVPQKLALNGDGRDAIAVNVHAIDAAGRFVPTDQRKVTFKVSGSGRILGVGNGDPNGHEADDATERSLFNGCCQVILQSEVGYEDIVLHAKADGMEEVRLNILINEVSEAPYVPTLNERYVNEWFVTQEASSKRRDPHAVMNPTDMNSWEKVNVSYGALNMLKGADGYVLFRNQLTLSEEECSRKPRLLFHSVGGQAEFYMNQALRQEVNASWPTEVEILLDDLSPNVPIELTVLVRIESDMMFPGLCGAVSLRCD